MFIENMVIGDNMLSLSPRTCSTNEVHVYRIVKKNIIYYLTSDCYLLLFNKWFL